MYFTQEDYKKIENWLHRNSVKDTEFQEALPFTGKEIVTVVQDGHNRKVNIQEFINQLYKHGVEDFLNVTNTYRANNITLKEAIRLIPAEARKEGQVITFLNTDGNWEIYQFIGKLNQWNNPTLWNNPFDWEKLVVDSILPDEEDLTKSLPDANGNSYLSLKDREYNPEDFSGLGRIILRKNIMEVEDPTYGKIKKNVLYQDMFTQSNTIYEIRYDFDLNGKEITIPEGCVLDFQGGSLINGILDLNNCFLNGNPKILCDFNGTINNNTVDVTWFGETHNDGLAKINNICKLTNHIIVPKGNYLINNRIDISLLSNKTLDFYGNIESNVVNDYCITFNSLYYSKIYFRGRIDGVGETNKAIKIGNAKFNNFAFSIISKFINCLHIQPERGFAHNDIFLGVLESDYDNSNLLLLDGGGVGSWVNENYWHNGYFGRYNSSTSNTTYVTGIKFSVGEIITDNTTTFNDNTWRDIAFEGINTVFDFNHVKLNVVENIRVERCGAALGSYLIRAQNGSVYNKINILYGALDSLSYDVFNNNDRKIFGTVEVLDIPIKKGAFNLTPKNIVPISFISNNNYNCISEFFVGTTSNGDVIDSFRYNLLDGNGYGSYSDIPAIQIEGEGKISKVSISSDTNVKVFAIVKELYNEDNNNHIISNVNSGSDAYRAHTITKQIELIFSANVKKAVIGFGYLSSEEGFKKLHIETENCNLITNYQNSIEALKEQSSRPNVAIKGFQYFDTSLNKPIWWTGSKWVDATGADV